MEDVQIRAIAEQVIRAGANQVSAAAQAVDDGFAAAAGRILGCKGKLLVTGAGTSGAIANRGAHLLSVCGTPAFYLSPSEGLHGGLGVLRPGDGVLALSKGGKSEELNDFCAKAKALCGYLAVITADPASPLGRIADDVIRLQMVEGADLGGVVATGSSLAMGAILDALAEVGRVASGYDWARLLDTHPAGVVGAEASQSLARLTGGEA